MASTSPPVGDTSLHILHPVSIPIDNDFSIAIEEDITEGLSTFHLRFIRFIRKESGGDRRFIFQLNPSLAVQLRNTLSTIMVENPNWRNYDFKEMALPVMKDVCVSIQLIYYRPRDHTIGSHDLSLLSPYS